jgi:hypothetical protein
MQDRRNPDVVVTGATGLVGRRLVPKLADRFSGIRILSRSAETPGAPEAPGAGDEELRRFRWDGVDPGPAVLSGASAVVHLAGEPIFGGLPTATRLAKIRDSRIDSTRAIVARISELDAANRPQTLVCASAVGIYGDRGESELDESAAPGTGFLAELCRDWEAAAQRACEVGVRVVSLRIGAVVSSRGGALPMMRLPFSLGLGGRLGSGRQYFPWIHLDDLVASFLFALESDVEGPLNAVAPEATRNLDLTRELGQQLGRPTWLPVPGFALRMVLGELAGELLGSRRVVPRRLQAAGFEFRYPSLEGALEAELG